MDYLRSTGPHFEQLVCVDGKFEVFERIACTDVVSSAYQFDKHHS